MTKTTIAFSIVLAQAVVLMLGSPSVVEGQTPIVRPAQDPAEVLTIQDPDDEQVSPSDQLLIADVEQDQQVPPERQPFGDWPKTGIRDISLDIREQESDVPPDLSGQLQSSGGSQWTEFDPTLKVFAWVAPDIRYQPLYFEDVALERYGQTASPYVQSTISAVHMFKSVVFLPNQMRHDAPGSCDGPLGFCRPGNDVPYTVQRTYLGRPRR